MPQYTNPLEALRKAQTIGPARPKTPYEQAAEDYEQRRLGLAPPRPDPALRDPTKTMGARLGSALGWEAGSPLEKALRVPGESVGVARDAMEALARVPIGAYKWATTAPGGPAQAPPPVPQRPSMPFQTPNVEAPTPSVYGPTATIEGLQAIDRLEAKAPYVRPGAGTPQHAVSTFQAFQPAPQERFTPDLAEMFRLASREDVPSPEGGLEYGVAPGASDYWKSRLGLRLGEEQFQTPEAQAAREMEMYKLGGPERAARIAGQADIEQQRVAGEYGLKQVESKGGQALNMMERLGQLGQAGPNVSRWSVPGGPSVSFAQERPVPTALSQQVVAAKSAYMAAKDRTLGSADREKSVYDLAVAQAVGANQAASPEIKQLVIQALTDPTLMDLPMDQVFDFSEADPMERKALVDIMLNVRGF